MRRFGWKSAAAEEEPRQTSPGSDDQRGVDTSPARSLSYRSTNSSRSGLSKSGIGKDESPSKLGAAAGAGAPDATGAGVGGSNKKMLKIGANVRFRGDVMECNTVIVCGRLQVRNQRTFFFGPLLWGRCFVLFILFWREGGKSRDYNNNNLEWQNVRVIVERFSERAERRDSNLMRLVCVCVRYYTYLTLRCQSNYLVFPCFDVDFALCPKIWRIEIGATKYSSSSKRGRRFTQNYILHYDGDLGGGNLSFLIPSPSRVQQACVRYSLYERERGGRGAPL